MRYPIRAAAASVAAVLLAAVAVSQIVAGSPTHSAAPRAAGAASDLTADKQAIQDALHQRQLTAPRGNKTADPGRPAANAAVAPEQAPVGMLGALNAPVSGQQFTPTNAWAGWTNSTRYTMVWAGYATDDTSQGLVFVIRRSGSDGAVDHSAPPVSVLYTPSGTVGALKIVGASANILDLADSGGQTVKFDPTTAPVK